MLKLYTAQVCPYAHRCRLALSYLHLEHQRVEIDLGAMPDWYRSLSPNQKVPLLEHDGRKIWESAIINEYLWEVAPGPSLSPWLRSRARLAIDWAGSQMIPHFYGTLRGQEGAAESLIQGLQGLPQWMAEEGPFWVGTEVSLADLALYPWFERLEVLQTMRGLNWVQPARLHSWWEAMRSIPAVVAEQSPAEFYLQGYARFGQPVSP